MWEQLLGARGESGRPGRRLLGWWRHGLGWNRDSGEKTDLNCVLEVELMELADG